MIFGEVVMLSYAHCCIDWNSNRHIVQRFKHKRSMEDIFEKCCSTRHLRDLGLQAEVGGLTHGYSRRRDSNGCEAVK